MRTTDLKLMASLAPTNVERSGTRCSAYSTWHRQFLGLAMIDIDAVEMCKACKDPIAFIETAIDVGQNIFSKNASVTTRIAFLCGIPGYTLLYRLSEDDRSIIGFRAIQLAPFRSSAEEVMEPEGWERHLRSLHAKHERSNCLKRPNAVIPMVRRAA